MAIRLNAAGKLVSTQADLAQVIGVSENVQTMLRRGNEEERNLASELAPLIDRFESVVGGMRPGAVSLGDNGVLAQSPAEGLQTEEVPQKRRGRPRGSRNKKAKSIRSRDKEDTPIIG